MQLYERAAIDLAYGQAVQLRDAASKEGDAEWTLRLTRIVGVLGQYRNLLDGVPLPSKRNPHIDDVAWGHD